MADTSKWHRISDVDEEAGTGTCSLCSPVGVRIRPGRGPECNRKSSVQATARGKNRPRPRRRRTVRGITPTHYDAILVEQGNACAICRQPFTASPHIDHDHQCCVQGCAECFRGLLCQPCNIGLGGFRDTPEFLLAAVTYLQTQKSPRAE